MPISLAASPPATSCSSSHGLATVHADGDRSARIFAVSVAVTASPWVGRLARTAMHTGAGRPRRLRARWWWCLPCRHHRRRARRAANALRACTTLPTTLPTPTLPNSDCVAGRRSCRRHDGWSHHPSTTPRPRLPRLHGRSAECSFTSSCSTRRLPRSRCKRAEMMLCDMQVMCLQAQRGSGRAAEVLCTHASDRSLIATARPPDFLRPTLTSDDAFGVLATRC